MSTTILNSQTFNDVMISSGINITNASADGYGSGISFYDFNQDGWDDLSFGRENAGPAIFINNQNSFQAAPISLNTLGSTKMFLWVDYDNDRDLDIYLTARNGKNKLYQNDGNFVFTEVSASAGLYTGGAANYGAAFGDYDKDGFLDLYVCKYYVGGGDSTNLEFVNNLYHNNGDGTFTDVSFSAGVSDGLAASFQAVWFDYNNDTWPDLYVVNDKLIDGNLYHNNGDGTFTKVTQMANLSLADSDLMSGSVADYNNDQYLDLFVSNTGGIPSFAPRLYENQGNNTFVNVYNQYSLAMNRTTWGGLWLDFDNNTKQDLYVATDYLDNYFYHNKLPLGFTLDGTIFNGTHSASSHAIARGDIDGNGFYDIAVYNEAPNNSFLWQNSGNANNYIKISVEGSITNSFAIGSWIKVFVNGKQYSQYTMCGENFLGQNSQHHIFGLGQDTIVDSVHVEYLSGIKDKYYNLAVNQNYQFVEGQANPKYNINLAGNNPFCAGDSVILSGPPNGQNYLWNTGDTTSSITIDTPGLFSFTALDSMGVPLHSNQFLLQQTALPNLLIFENAPLCAGDSDGQLIVDVFNQGQDYEIQWSTGHLGDTLNGVNSGIYHYFYEDNNGCTWQDFVFVDEPFPLNLQLSVVPETIDDMGSINCLMNGGSPPYVFVWDGDTVVFPIEDLTSQMYQLEVWDSHFCYLKDSIIVGYQSDSVLSSVQGLPVNELFEIRYDAISKMVLIKFHKKLDADFELQLYTSIGELIPIREHIREGDNRELLIDCHQLGITGLHFLTMNFNEIYYSLPLYVR